MDAIADDAPPSVASLAAYLSAGRIWVVTSSSDPTTPIAYMTADFLAGDGLVHVAQVTVAPEYARQGIGTRLLRQLKFYAAARHRTMRVRGLSLTTFRFVPWNRPMYERLGFDTLSDEKLHQEGFKELRSLVEAEARNEVLKSWPRCAMVMMFED